MYERSTDDGTLQKAKEVYPTAKASGSQRMGVERKRGRGCQEIPGPPSHSISVEKGPGLEDVAVRRCLYAKT